MRVAALWFPDWPVHAARLADEAGEGIAEPIAIAARHRVVVCSAPARQLGVRRGMKVRAAQAVCPQLVVCEADPDRDGRMFASLAAGFDDVASSVEVLRPGLVIVDLGASAKFHGSEDAVLEMLIDTAARKGIGAQAGAADEIATAVIAARSGVIVKKSSEFLATQPIGVLVAEVSFGIDPDVVRSLSQLGVRTLGDLAALPSTAVSTRFGQPGLACHRIARGAPDRRVAPELPTTDWAVSITPEEPIERVDAAAFAARQLAAGLHEKLKNMGQTCVRLKVIAELEGETRLERVWRTRDALTEAATADRVRWQLDGWLTGGGSGAITSLILEPLELTAPEPVGQLWRDSSSTDGARRVVERVQSTLGIDAVVQPALVGGRGVGERVALVPFGDQAPEIIDAPWPGAIPAPLPARLGGGVAHPASRIIMVDEAGTRIQVTAEALLSGRPYALKWGDSYYLVTGWAGPWPVDAGWWGKVSQRVARLQVVGTRHDDTGKQYAWLLQWTNQQWRIEALYS